MADDFVDNNPGIRLRVWGRLAYDIVFEQTMQQDVAFAFFSAIFVFCFAWFHLQSLLMAILFFFMIVLSFPVSFFIYTGVLQVSMNTYLN